MIIGCRSIVRFGARALLSATGAAAGLALLVGCASERDRDHPFTDGRSRLPATLLVGAGTHREEGEFELGPPPYGYVKLLGHAVPDWQPDGFETRASPLDWTFVGPKPVFNEYWSGDGNASGRIVSVAPHPTISTTCYIAAASGGVWKTTNSGVLWTPLTDQLSILNSGALAIDPSNPETIYYGAGDLRVGSNGDGIFRSMDGGSSWVRLATTAQVGNQITRIVVNPTNPNTIHISGSSGYKRTTDGGTTWTGPASVNGNCWGVAINNTTPTTVYVAREKQGVYRSTDNGTTFTKLAGGLPASGFVRIEIAISKSNPLVLYAAFINEDATIGSVMIGLYRTADGGTTWVKKDATPNFCYPQCNYDAFVGVSPTNENIVFCGGVDPRYALAGIIKSTDGGNSWTEVSDGPTSLPVHPDHHCIAWGPTGIIWEGNDGGIYRSTDGGNNWNNLNSNLAVTELYDIAVNPADPERMLGGSQDNGTPERNGNTIPWPQLQVGDGGTSVFDPTDVLRRYTTYPLFQLTRWYSGSATDITGGINGLMYWTAPMVGDPNDPKTLLVGTEKVWRTNNADGAASWSTISPTLAGSNAALNAIAVAVGHSNTIYTGSGDGRVYVTTDAVTWTNRTSGLPAGQVSDIIISPTDQLTAYVSFYNTTGGRIYKTTNKGVNWTNVTGSLPAGVSVTALEVDFRPLTPGLYAGSGAGLYYSLDNGATWTRNNSSLPNVNIADLQIDPVNFTITAGTHGRGAWRARLSCPADYNGDGFVDGIDYDMFNNDFENPDPAQQIRADYNHDGFVDGIDYDNFNNDFEHGC